MRGHGNTVVAYTNRRLLKERNLLSDIFQIALYYRLQQDEPFNGLKEPASQTDFPNYYKDKCIEYLYKYELYIKINLV